MAWVRLSARCGSAFGQRLGYLGSDDLKLKDQENRGNNHLIFWSKSLKWFWNVIWHTHTHIYIYIYKCLKLCLNYLTKPAFCTWVHASCHEQRLTAYQDPTIPICWRFSLSNGTWLLFCQLIMPAMYICGVFVLKDFHLTRPFWVWLHSCHACKQNWHPWYMR